MAIKTVDKLMAEMDIALTDTGYIIHRLDRILHAEVMEEDLPEVLFRAKIDQLVELVAKLADHKMLGRWEHVATRIQMEGRSKRDDTGSNQ